MHNRKSIGLSKATPDRVMVQLPTPDPKGNRGCKRKCSDSKLSEWLVCGGSLTCRQGSPLLRGTLSRARKSWFPYEGFPWQRAGSRSGINPLRPGPPAMFFKNRSSLSALGQPA